MKRRVLDSAWKRWLQENLERRCDHKELVAILLKNDFSLSAIKGAMAAVFPVEYEFAGSPEPTPSAIATPFFTRQKNPKLTKIDTDLLQLYTLDDFLAPRECDDLVAIIDHYLRPSTLTTAEKDSSFRTSRTCDLSLLQSPVVAAVDERIARTVGIRLPYAEGNQAQRYDIGQQFKAHTDYFEPNTSEYAAYGGSRGNRTWTFMVYLNEGMMGGGTKFLAIDKTFRPKKGQAVIWNNLRDDGTPNPDTLHSGEPVIMGHKIIITQWFREQGVGPMFY
jgi:prolyl 4-hydroxylase